MAEKNDKNAPKGERTSAKDIRQRFYTNITNDVATISDRRTKTVLLQSRISRACDPTITNEYVVAVSRLLLKYIKDSRRDIEETTQR